jgi:hypothetical protein
VRNGTIGAVIDGGHMCGEQASTVTARSAPAELIWLNRGRTDLITTPADRRPFWHGATPTALTVAGSRRKTSGLHSKRGTSTARDRLTTGHGLDIIDGTGRRLD